MARRKHHHLVRAACVLAITALVCAWCVGRLCSDRFAWSQPIAWVPPMLLAAPVWLAVLVTTLRVRTRGRRERRRGRAPVRSIGPSVIRTAGWGFVVMSLAHLAFVELGLHRVVRQPPAGAEPGLRIAFWNQAGHEAGAIASAFLGHDPTLFVLANRHTDTTTRDLAQAYIDSGEAHAAVGWPFDLFSRLPIRRWASTSLGLDGRSRAADSSPRADPGWAAWFEVETGHGPLVIWAIDLPSDPGLARLPLARHAGETIARWTGSARDERGALLPMPDGVAGFPTPDLVVGDFNIPRGSASLAVFLRASGAGAMRNAFDRAGVGWQRTWPRETPVWAIDQCFVGERLTVRTHATFDPGLGGHRALLVECSPR